MVVSSAKRTVELGGRKEGRSLMKVEIEWDQQLSPGGPQKKETLHTSWCRGPYTTCQGSGREEFGLSGKDGIQTEEGRAGCGCGDVMKADRWSVTASVLKWDLPRSPG